MNLKPLLILVLVALLAQPNEGRRRRTNNSCTRHNQCYTGRCIRHNDYLCGLGSKFRHQSFVSVDFLKMSNYFVGFIGNIFGGGRRRKQKICHSYKCAQCTSNRHCSGNQYCSGYTCVSHQTYTQAPYSYTTTKSPFYNNNANYNNYNKDYNNFNSYKFTTPKPFDFPTSKYNNFDTSKYTNFDTSSFNTNFDSSSSFSADEFGAFGLKK